MNLFKLLLYFKSRILIKMSVLWKISKDPAKINLGIVRILKEVVLLINNNNSFNNNINKDVNSNLDPTILRDNNPNYIIINKDNTLNNNIFIITLRIISKKKVIITILMINMKFINITTSLLVILQFKCNKLSKVFEFSKNKFILLYKYFRCIWSSFLISTINEPNDAIDELSI